MRTGRTAAARRRAKTPRAYRQESQTESINIGLLRIVTCGVIFVVLVMLKLLIPGSLSSVRGTLGSWLVRDADFVEAFSAIGHAVSGENGVLDSLESAYVAVFAPAEATEVSAPAELKDDTGAVIDGGTEKDALPEADRYPEYAVREQRVLGFDYTAPLSGEITSGFGWREHPVNGRETFHYGVDLAAAEGTDILCFADGTVGIVAESVELGKYLTVHHENGIITLYGHCSRIVALPGETVRRGAKIAESGSTGNATGPHLHFELQDGEEHLNPIYYLS